MPAMGIEYALLQHKYQYENMRQEVSSHQSRARERERYLLASQRNGLEEQRGNLWSGLERLPVPMRGYYLEKLRSSMRRSMLLENATRCSVGTMMIEKESNK